MPADAKKRVRALSKQPRSKVKRVDPYDLTKRPTRVLLNWLASARATGGGYDPFYDGNGNGISIEAIKAELAKREHVPSKREGSAIRRKKALGKKSVAKKTED